MAQSIDSLTSSSWSMSGPELIMPSIYEAPVSEASWVAPVRSKDQTSSGTMRKRRKIGPNPQQDTAQELPDAGSSEKQLPSHQPKPSLVFKFKMLYEGNAVLIRTAINSLLIVLILHLLVLPELIYQAQSLCQLPTVQAIYPSSCVRLEPRPFYPSSPIISPEETLTAAQKHLESIFTSALTTLYPLSETLKESELMLEDLQSQLHTTIPDARNALDLEFQGSDAALRAATWEFDSLRADLRSAVDSLLASPPSQESSAPSIARDTRLAAQLRRRAEYLDRLRAQLRSKADSLSARFTTLDDHLEAVEGIISREERRDFFGGTVTDQSSQARLQSVLDSLSSYAFGSHFFGKGAQSHPLEDDQSGHQHRRVTPLTLLRLAAARHRPVADAVSRLSRQLADVPRFRMESMW